MTDAILLEKNGIIIKKIKADHYTVAFTIEHHADVSHFINVHLIKLIYDSNTDLFVSFQTESVNPREQHFYLLFKHLFADMGIPQYYYNFSMKQVKDTGSDLGKTIKFLFTPIDSSAPGPCTAVAAPLSQIEMSCTITDRTVGQFMVTIVSDSSELFATSFLEKMMSMLLFKLINRLKQYISTII